MAAYVANAAALHAAEATDAAVRTWFQFDHSRTYTGQYAAASGDM